MNLCDKLDVSRGVNAARAAKIQHRRTAALVTTFGGWQRYWRRGVYAMIGVGVRKKEIGAMRRWYLPLTVLGLASLGALILTQRGRQALAWLADNFDQADMLFEWNETTQRELERLRAAVNQLADSLETGC